MFRYVGFRILVQPVTFAMQRLIEKHVIYPNRSSLCSTREQKLTSFNTRWNLPPPPFLLGSAAVWKTNLSIQSLVHFTTKNDFKILKCQRDIWKVNHRVILVACKVTPYSREVLIHNASSAKLGNPKSCTKSILFAKSVRLPIFPFLPRPHTPYSRWFNHTYLTFTFTSGSINPAL